MRSERSAVIVGLVFVSAFLLWPAMSEAGTRQRAIRAPRPAVFAGGYYYGYRPFIWNPWYPGWYWPHPYDYYRYARYEETGAVRLQVTPREAKVYVDGYFVGIVDDFNGVFQRLRLPAGGHEIAVHQEGFRTLRQSIYVQPGSTMSIRAALAPLQPGEPGDPLPVPSPAPATQAGYAAGPTRPPARRVPALGTLSLRIDPADAEIRVAGSRWQRADSDEGFTIELPEGTHRVEVRRSGYGRFMAEVEVRSGEVTSLDVTLPPSDRQP
jgi:hypothetical protein